MVKIALLLLAGAVLGKEDENDKLLYIFIYIIWLANNITRATSFISSQVGHFSTHTI